MVDLEMPDMAAESVEDPETNEQIYDIDAIISGRGLDIWHGEDPLIKTQEIVTGIAENHLYTSVVHLGRKTKWVQLADKTMPEVRIAHNSKRLLGYSNQPYQRGDYLGWKLQ